MTPWLIQSGKCRYVEPYIILEHHIKSLSDIIERFDYMGSAEFEFGAVGNAFREIVKNFNQYRMFKLKSCKEVENLYIICNERDAINVSEIVHNLANYDFYYQLKKSCNMIRNVNKNHIEYDRKYVYRSNFWIDIENLWIAVYGYRRAKAFEIALQAENFKWRQ